MHIVNDEDIQSCSDILEAITADRFAEQMDDMLLDIEEMDLHSCPPDKRFFLGDREAWVYEHGNISELVFVKV